MPDRLPEHHLVSVFVALNLRRRELYVGATVMLPSQLGDEFPRRPAPPVAHWKGEPAELEFLRYAVPKSEARRLIASYAPARGKADWVVHRQPLA